MQAKSLRSKRRSLLAAAITSLALLACCDRALAQETSTHGDLLGPGSERRIERQGQPTEAEGGPRTPTAVGEKAIEPSGITRPEPFGANLFRGAAPAVSDRPNPNYLIQPGDRIDVRIWGGIEADTSGVVDPNGNLFVPNVGPMHVEGVRAGDLQSGIERELRRLYTQNIQVYAVLVTTHRVGVFVTGFVRRPGRYSGAGGDSVLDYLVRAGGIDPARGSYRDIVLQRAERTITHIDLYRFLVFGSLPQVNLREGDAIVVGKQNAMVAVDGAARNDFLFELSSERAAGRELMQLARPLPAATNAIIQGTRNEQPFSRYLTLSELASTVLVDQDKLTFVTDAPATTVQVQVQGSRIGPSVLVADRTIRLRDILDYIAVDPQLADTHSIFMLRRGVAEQQRRSMNEALDRLQRSLHLATSATTGVAQIRANEAQLVSKYIEQARKAQPDGVLVVADRAGNVADVRMEDGDVIVIPEKSQTVFVTGEVLAPQPVLYRPGWKATDYINRAGGFSERGAEDQFIIRRANGEIILDTSTPLAPGDELIVLPHINPQHFQLVRDLLSVVTQNALVASVFMPPP